MEVFKDFYIFPHEFLSLILNARDRLGVMKSPYEPSDQIQRKELTNWGKYNL
jgi:hypothetical protein